ncbi:MAG: acyltransferase [Pseudomonadota bacterium]
MIDQRVMPKNAWLDLLRCVAIILVLLRHGCRALNAQGMEYPPFIQNLMINGWIGVDLFFVLSGYLIGCSLADLQQKNTKASLIVFFRKRAYRILPAYYTVLILSVLFIVMREPVGLDNVSWRLLYHMLMMQDYFPANINVVFWSLGVEAKFYLIAPLLFAGMLTSKRLFLAISLIFLFLSPVLRGIIFFLAGQPDTYTEFWPLLRSPLHACIEPLILGLVLSVLHQSGRLKVSKRLAMGLFYSSLLILSVWMMRYDFMKEITIFDAMLQPFLIAVLVSMSVAGAVVLNDVTLKGAALFAWGARLSYAAYLVHFPLIRPLTNLILADPGAATAYFWVWYLALTILLAWLLNEVVEKPFQRIGKQVSHSHTYAKNDELRFVS